MESVARDEEGGARDGDGGGGSGAAAGGGPRRQTDPSSERQVIRWERFLPRRFLRILLVEHDDSTRHIVAALLRKCSYHVAAVADGLKAWEVLKEKHYSVDLVLTEVAMPSLSGIALLSKIMSTEECKNIPVIMMSSHDSIGVVLKCMLKGAVDFLVKPVRKNELRNLWQHVWRRHCSNSYTNASDNNAASNHVSAIAGDGSKTGESSKQDSDAQSSDRKPEMEIASDQKHRGDHLAEGGSTSREVEAKPEQLDNGTPIMANTLKLDDDVEVISAGTDLVEKYQEENGSYHKAPYREEDNGFTGSKEGDLADPNSHCQNNAPDGTLNDMTYFEPVANRKCNSAVSEKYAFRKDALPETSTSSHAKSASEFGSSPHLELALKRQRLNGCVDQDFKQKHILNHSNASAFSRYGDKRAHHSCKKPVSSAVCVRTIECVDKSQLHVSSHGSDNDKNISLSPKGMVFYQGNAGETTKYFQVSSESNGEHAGLMSFPAREDDCAGHSSKGEDMVFNHPQFGFIPLPIPVGAIPYQRLCSGYGAILQPVFHPEASLEPHSSASAEKATVQITSDQSGHHDNHLISHRQCIEFHHHEENHQSHYWRQHIDMEPGDSSDLSCTPEELANQSASCSEDILKGGGSNYSGEPADAAANTGTTLGSGTESGAQNCSRKGLDSDRSSREAALIKFRMKRKDRCFEKKVRYHGRKKLAEQRPRVKGQFVSQKVPDSVTKPEAEDRLRVVKKLSFL
ncbi:two-component response regulator-like APRR3 isoform X2 [Phoenix dactylifera]|uniref:Two-component response regulator-like APRR3 isoform X2 n=1 Tax=Phoenix dactylifera TaxID=42345 RepID=A0A8B7MVG6_PHODC|nr:two-component response regulator-like APRR3 isoform X2 [Phoenix dactylifera]